ncbi:MAG: hypothetical protein HYU36_21110 [Planctomycetes bacterium]|nr:hypothetical protein [Planctomycetota bacterium]
MIPLHGYRTLADLRDSSMFWDVRDKMDAQEGIYCGPGIFYDVKTGRIHARLAHTSLEGLHEDNYRGETDPRLLPLVIAGLKAGPVLSLRGARWLQFQDLVVRGARTAAIDVEECACLLFDGLTVYGGAAAFSIRDTTGLRLLHTACRGIAAPWTFRGSLKYRAIEARIFSASGWEPTGIDNQDFELAYSEFTDCVDGVFIGNVRGVWFHHNLVDNISDDGLFLTAATGYDGVTPGGDIHIFQNRLARCLTTLAFGVGHGRQKTIPGGHQTGSGVHIYRNVFDYRRPVMYVQPGKPEDDQEITSRGRFASDHGSPAWEPMNIYHNTLIAGDPASDYGAFGLGDHLLSGGARRVFNNIIVQTESVPGQTLPDLQAPAASSTPPEAGEAGASDPDPVDELVGGDPKRKGSVRSTVQGTVQGEKVDSGADDEVESDAARSAGPASEKPPAEMRVRFEADGNLHWSPRHGDSVSDFLGAFRRSPRFEASKKAYPPGWANQDLYADPGFTRFDPGWRATLDLRLRPGSPAIDSGVPLPSEWPDPVRAGDAGLPDRGALPYGMMLWRVGVRGRLTLSGEDAPALDFDCHTPKAFAGPPPQTASTDPPPPGAPVDGTWKPALVLPGDRVTDEPLLLFALKRRRVSVHRLAAGWPDPAELGRHGLVAVAGCRTGPEGTSRRFGPAELQAIEVFLKDGGALLLGRASLEAFQTPEGQDFLDHLGGMALQASAPKLEILQPDHPWVKHLDPGLARRVVQLPGALVGPAEDQDMAEPPSMVSEIRWEAYLDPTRAALIHAREGDRLIGDAKGATSLYRLRVGRGQFIYIGWRMIDSLPPGRSPSTVDQERLFEQQMQILLNLVEEIY